MCALRTSPSFFIWGFFDSYSDFKDHVSMLTSDKRRTPSLWYRTVYGVPPCTASEVFLKFQKIYKKKRNAIRVVQNLLLACWAGVFFQSICRCYTHCIMKCTLERLKKKEIHDEGFFLHTLLKFGLVRNWEKLNRSKTKWRKKTEW